MITGNHMTKMSKTFAETIEELANGHPILGIVVQPHQRDSEDSDPWIDDCRVHQWDSIREQLDYLWDRGYGAPDCHAIVAWTEKRVIFVSCCDGATSVHWLPAMPQVMTANYIGGW